MAGPFITTRRLRLASTVYVLCFTLPAFLSVVLVVPAAPIDAARLPPPAARPIEYLRDIKPLLDAHCLKCHGPEKPKSRFRIDDREALLKGGENGTNVYPGRSADSPLIHFVARLVPEMEMPPIGKGEPLDSEQIGRLRAWIDQGLPWGGAVTAATTTVSFAPAAGWFSVSGNEKKFREHLWLREGWNGGLKEFSMTDQLQPGTKFSIGGHALPDDYKISLSLDRADLGFARGGFEQYRKYYDDSGGYYRPFNTSPYSLDRDLHLDIGRAWFEVGLTKPRLPQIVAGYEYKFNEGAKSTLQWGLVPEIVGGVNNPGNLKGIYPAAKDVMQHSHLFRLDASHDVGFALAEDSFRYENYSLDTYRANAITFQQGVTRPGTVTRLDEGSRDNNLANAFRLERQLRDWWFISAGHLYTHSDGEAYFHQSTVSANGLPTSGQFWQAPAVILDQSSQTFNFNNAFGPWKGFSFSAGLQAEWASQRGFGNVDLTEGDPNDPSIPFGPTPAIVSSDLDRFTSDEKFVLRYTLIPHTVLFADARFKQEQIGQFEEQGSGALASTADFLRDTDAENDWKEYRGGFHVSPWRWFSLNSHYARRDHESDFDHLRDLTLNAAGAGAPNLGYSAFIRSRETHSDLVEAKMVLRPVSWLKTTLGYKRARTRYHTATDPLAGTTSGAGLEAGIYDSDIYSLNTVFTPNRRWYLSMTFSYFDSRTIAADNNSRAVAPYEGQTYSVLASSTYILNEMTDLHASYSFSHADFAQDNESFGLPLGVNYQWHGLQAGVRRKLWKHFTVDLHYSFYLYDEPTSGGAGDYTAHGVFALLNVKLP